MNEKQLMLVCNPTGFVETTCTSQPIIEHSTVTTLSGTCGTSYCAVGTTLTYRCDTGYVFPDTHEIGGDITCEEDFNTNSGRWTFIGHGCEGGMIILDNFILHLIII